jgi:hypothetical protein
VEAMNIRNVPEFFRENGKPELALAVDLHLKGQKDNGIEDKLDTEVLLGYLIEEYFTPPTPEEIILSPNFSFLKALAIEIHKLENPEALIELDEREYVSGVLL